MFNRFFPEGGVEKIRKRNQLVHLQYVREKAYKDAEKKDDGDLTITAATLRMSREEFERRYLNGTLPNYKSG